MDADSFIIFPNFPVKIIPPPFWLTKIASTKRVAPPIEVYANPNAVPGLFG